jgi:hypothetical protein
MSHGSNGTRNPLSSQSTTSSYQEINPTTEHCDYLPKEYAEYASDTVVYDEIPESAMHHQKAAISSTVPAVSIELNENAAYRKGLYKLDVAN